MRHGAETKGRVRVAVVGVIATLAAAAWISVYRLWLGQQNLDAALVLYLVIAGVLLYSLAASAAPRTFHRRPVARGRTVCIIPSFNEDQAALNETVRSILAGTVVPDEIHVVDDGSTQPVRPWPHPRVWWHRQANAGKREAQALVLRQLLADEEAGRHRIDYLMTVDSDCTVERRALQHLLRSMSDDRVQAATGLPLLRNRSANWITRVTDLEMVAACLTLRAARSRMGVVAPCSGALSLYRAELVLDNLDDYVTSGTAGDDRRLTHYALLRGHAVSVDDALVETEMPSTLRSVYKQRVRWFKSYWRYAPWEIAHLPALPVWWRGYALVMSVVVPMALVWVLCVAPLLGHGLQWQGLAYWAGLSWINTLKYASVRPGAPWYARWGTWLVGTPLLMLLQVFLLRPSMVQAFFQARTNHWNATRGEAVEEARPPGEPTTAELWLFGDEPERERTPEMAA